MTSQGDTVRQMLGVTKGFKKVSLSAATSRKPSKKEKKETKKSLDVSVLATTVARPWKDAHLQPPVAKWVVHNFTNNGRNDNLVLQRWEREDRVNEPYSYAAFNVKPKIYRYTPDQWNCHISKLDAEWSRQETDHLMDLCERFDLRFHIIFDRFDPNYRKKLEDIKERYYSIARKVMELQMEGSRADEEKSRHPLFRFSYSKQHDEARKMMLRRAMDVPQKIRDQEKLLIEKLRKLETKLKKDDKDAKEATTLSRKQKKKLTIEDSTSLMLPITLDAKRSGVVLRSSFDQPLSIFATDRLATQAKDTLTKLNIPAKTSMYTEAIVHAKSCLLNDALAVMQLERLIKRKEEEKHNFLQWVKTAQKTLTVTPTKLEPFQGFGKSEGVTSHGGSTPGAHRSTTGHKRKSEASSVLS
eukprot:Platyproteum_vivax@DN8555_c0_g1_i1.p1